MELYITNVDYKRKDPVFWIEVQVISRKLSFFILFFTYVNVFRQTA